MKIIYFETVDLPSAAIYKIYAVYPEAIWYKLTLSFKEREFTIETNTLLSSIEPNL